jgi:hypothetical protein
MSNEIYANGCELACKAGDGKVIASFPDVCLSPPSPPAGPIPVPYPNTSFAKDMKNGSKTVKISNKEVMLKDKSYYKTSPLGDEAATRSFGANILSHVITGKTYFVAWSMDVKFEGLNVDRHIDLTTSNHASWPAGVSIPNPNLDAMSTAKLEKTTDKCACCGQSPRMPGHSEGRPMTFSGWYGLNKKNRQGKLTYEAKRRRAVVARLARAKEKRGCNCKVFPEKPCNVFRELRPGEKQQIDAKWDRRARRRFQALCMPPIQPEAVVQAALTTHTHIPTQYEIEQERKGNHLTPRTGGGCPNPGPNVVPNRDLCKPCRNIDALFTRWQGKR